MSLLNSETLIVKVKHILILESCFPQNPLAISRSGDGSGLLPHEQIAHFYEVQITTFEANFESLLDQNCLSRLQYIWRSGYGGFLTTPHMLQVADGGFGPHEEMLSCRGRFLQLWPALCHRPGAVSPWADAPAAGKFHGRSGSTASLGQEEYLWLGYKQLRGKKKKGISQCRHRGGKNSIVARGTVIRNTFGWK